MQGKYLLLSLCFVFFVFSASGVSVTNANEVINEVTNEVANEVVPVEEAIKAATALISSSVYSSDWADAIIEHKYNLYDLDDSLLGYYMVVKKNNSQIGYMVVSATKDRVPVLEYGEDHNFNFEEEVYNKGNKIFYLGYNFLAAKNGMELKERHKLIKDNTIKKLEKEGKTNTPFYNDVLNMELKSIERNKEINSKKWDELLGNKRDKTVRVSATTYKVLNVSHLSQRMSGVDHPDSACGPTTGAMIVNYYNYVQGYDVDAGVDLGGNHHLINHLYEELGTTIIGTFISEYTSGMHEHLNHNMTGWMTWDLPADEYYLTYELAISDGDPVALRFDRFRENDDVYVEYHFVAGIGYDKGSGTIYAGIKDPDSTSSTKWISWDVNDQDIELGFQNHL